MRSEIARPVGGAVLTEKFFRPHGRIAWRKAASATPHRTKRSRTRKSVRQRAGAALTGRSSRVPPEECQKRGGQYFTSQKEAIEHCKPCWVCIDGQAVKTTEADALQKGLKCYPSAQEAAQHCEKLCWCCIKNELFHITEAECRRRGGKCYRTREEALRHCTEKPRWTCTDGKVVQTTEGDCQAKGLQCYSSQQEAQSHCPVTGDCWCCVDMPTGMGVVNTTPEDCEKRGTGVVGDHCYSSKEDAVNHCRPTYCCIQTPTGTTIIRTTEADCIARGGDTSHMFQTEAEAQKSCGPTGPTPSIPPPPLCWVCIDRNVTQMSVSDAQARKLRYYNSREDAQRSCAGDGTPLPTCWVCIDGRVTQVPEAEAKKRHLQCYGSEEEARSHCQPKTVWCCVDGQVVQLTEEECRCERWSRLPFRTGSSQELQRENLLGVH